MLEIKSRVHCNRYFATQLSWLDLFRVVHYFDYQGDRRKIPFFYLRKQGVSCYTDLTLSMEDILASMKSNTRNEIRRAQKEGLTFETDVDLADFVPFYNDFCTSKNLNDYADRARIAKYKNVLISKVMHGDLILAMHVNVLDRTSRSAFLLFSCSKRLSENVDRKMIGWGNKFLHYKELEWLKVNGFEHYDWSGICLTENDPRYTIGQFKLSFGGRITYPLMLRTPLFAVLEFVRNRFVKLRKYLGR